MPLVAAAVCPQPPLLVPQLAAGAAGELAGLRDACHAAVAQLAGAEVDRLVVVGGDTQTVRREPPHGGTFRPWGLDLAVGDPAGGFPLSLLIGAWLLAGVEPGPATVGFQSVAFDASTAECAALGRALVDADRVGLLVLGDGSAKHGPKAPGYDDPRAADFDAAVVAALAKADTGALLALDPALAAELLAAGRAAWQVLAGAADRQYTGEILAHEAPYGVGYFVASWR